MKLTADANCYLTEAYEVTPDKRTYCAFVIVESAEEAMKWKQVTEAEKASFEARASLFAVQDVTPGVLAKVDALVSGISEHINDNPMSVKDSLTHKKYFPAYENLIGRYVMSGFRLKYGDTLYEVVQAHRIAKEWKPGQGTESLYKVVEEDAAGTKDAPIGWKPGMELIDGKYYTDKGVLYECIRNSGIGLSFNLADLVSGGYVKVANN